MSSNKIALPNTEVIKITGNLTIENIQEIYQLLTAAIDNTQKVSLIFENVTAVDLSFVQLLCAAHRTAVNAGKSTTLSSLCPEGLKTTVRELGFIQEQGCVLDSQCSCLWKEGWE